MRDLHKNFSNNSVFLLNKTVFGISLSLVSSMLHADWTYLEGPGSWNVYTGLPNTVETLTISDTLQPAVIKWLPEGVALPDKATQYTELTDDAGANIPSLKIVEAERQRSEDF